MTSNIFIDATLFMGMNSEDKLTRGQSLGVMSHGFKLGVHMNLEQVGLCDHWVWSYERNIQDDYYPFMDLLHSEMNIHRIPYSEEDIIATQVDQRMKNSALSPQQKLLISQVINAKGKLYTHDPLIIAEKMWEGFIGSFKGLARNMGDSEPVFSPEIDALYLKSMALKVKPPRGYEQVLERNVQ